MAPILQGGVKDVIGFDTSGKVTAKFVVTNITEAYSLNCDANDDLVTADTLGTLIRELIQRGVINGTVA